MAALLLHANGPARPERVWRDYVEPARWPDWSPQLRRAELDGGGTRLTAGATGRVWPRVLPVPLAFTILDVDETERYWIWRIGVGGVHLDLTHDVETTAEGTETNLRIDGPLILFPAMLAYAPLAQLALNRLVREQAVTAESQHLAGLEG